MADIGAMITAIGEVSETFGGEGEVTDAAQTEAAQVAATQAGAWPTPLPGLRAPPRPVAVIGALPPYAVAAGDAWLKAWFNAFGSDLLRKLAASQSPPWRVS